MTLHYSLVQKIFKEKILEVCENSCKEEFVSEFP